MRNELIVVSMLLCAAVPAAAQVGFGSAHVSIGINVPIYPQLLRIPDYPVYYASELDSNYFFYDGLYWVYQDDYWYSSSWYDGPWDLIEPDYVPLFILRVPVRYYRRPPIYFGGWQRDAAPHWGQHWGNQWAQHRSGWDQWNHASAPAPAPLPSYQKQYRGDRYPRAPQQQALRDQNYRYQSRDPVVRQRNEVQPRQDASRPGQQAMPNQPRTQSAQSRSEPGRDQQRPAPTQRQPDQGASSRNPSNQGPSNQGQPNHDLPKQTSADNPQPTIRQNSRQERRPEQRQQPAPNANQPGPPPQAQHGPPQPRSEPQPARDEGRKQNDDRGRDHDR